MVCKVLILLPPYRKGPASGLQALHGLMEVCFGFEEAGEDMVVQGRERQKENTPAILLPRAGASAPCWGH